MQAQVDSSLLFFAPPPVTADEENQTTAATLQWQRRRRRRRLTPLEPELVELFSFGDFSPEGSPVKIKENSPPSSPSGSPQTLSYYKKHSWVDESSDTSPAEKCSTGFTEPSTEGNDSSATVCNCGGAAAVKRFRGRLSSAPGLAPPPRPPCKSAIQPSPPPPAATATTPPSPPPMIGCSSRRLDGIARWTSNPPEFPSVLSADGVFPPHSMSGPRNVSLPRGNDPPSAFVSSLYDSSSFSPGHRVRVLILVPEEEPFTGIIRDAKNNYHELLENRCNFIVQVIVHDSRIRGYVQRYNPNVIVTTGTHWMQIVLSGLVDERRIYSSELQDVGKMHGQMLQISVCGVIRYVFPLVGYTRRRNSSPSYPLPDRQKTRSPVNNGKISSGSGARRDLSMAFESMKPSGEQAEENESVPASASGSSREDAFSLAQCLDPTTDEDITKLMMFLAEQVSSLTPPASTSGSPVSANGSHFEIMYGGRRTPVTASTMQQQQQQHGDVIQTVASYNHRYPSSPSSGAS
jgi:hypothetical protein